MASTFQINVPPAAFFSSKHWTVVDVREAGLAMRAKPKVLSTVKRDRHNVFVSAAYGSETRGHLMPRSDDSGEVRFGRFRFDLRRRLLLHDDGPVVLGGRALDFLCLLASARGAVPQQG